MQNAQIFLPLDIYYKCLNKINEVEFTPREMDVIACILNQRAASISSFLFIGQRAVETHIRNIRQKAGGLGGRENIIDFIEKSGKLPLIKHEYYASLQLRVLFEEKLRKIAKEVKIELPECLFVYDKEKLHSRSFLVYLKEHLKCVGFSVKTYSSDVPSFFTQPDDFLPLQDTAHVVCVVPKNMNPSFVSQVQWKHPSCLICLVPNDIIFDDEPKELKNISFLKISEEENYYLSFFEILKKLLPDTNFDKVIAEFKEQCKTTHILPINKILEEPINITGLCS